METTDRVRRESIQRILRRRRNSRVFFSPEEPCSKCGAFCWERETHDTWSCFKCGNLCYLRNVADSAASESSTIRFVQQSDLRKAHKASA